MVFLKYKGSIYVYVCKLLFHNLKQNYEINENENMSFLIMIMAMIMLMTTMMIMIMMQRKKF